MSVRRGQVAAVVVTRGDVNLHPVLTPLQGLAEVTVWDNSVRQDVGVYGRYAALDEIRSPVVVTVDDDTALRSRTVQRLLAAYEPGTIVCNVPARFRDRYTDSGLVGFGAIFDRHLAGDAFARFRRQAGHVDEQWFRRTCDIVFTMLGGPLKFVDLPYVELPWARADNRMWLQPDHADERNEMRSLCRQVRERVAA